MKGVERRRWS